MALVAHLSGPHLTTGPLAGGPAAGLHAALGRLLGLPTRPDAAVVTGDLTDHGHPDEYHQLAELLAEIPVPVYLATGNHDNRDALLDTFAGTAVLVAAQPDRTVVTRGRRERGNADIAATSAATRVEQPVTRDVQRPFTGSGC